MNQVQIQSLNLLGMSAEDLREEILLQVEKNPALELYSEKSDNRKKDSRTDKERGLHEGTASSSGDEKSEAFQNFLENQPDDRETLYDHLTAQLGALKIPSAQKAMCQKIIGNLDSRGYHIFEPHSLLKDAKAEASGLLEKCLSIVQSFEPSGICVKDFRESLLLQARQREDAPQAALFLLDGHFEFLDPPAPQKILKKIQDFSKEQKKLSFKKGAPFSMDWTEADIQEALSFIRTLDPFPARNFSQAQTKFVEPDIFVERVSEPEQKSTEQKTVDLKDRTVQTEMGFSFHIRLSDKIIPSVQLSKKLLGNENAGPSSKEVQKSVHDAKIFLESLEHRKTTIANAACVIVQKQMDFFLNGPGHLAPLVQSDVAKEIGVHETTISRMASSKYIQCSWGLFPVKYFFTSAVPQGPKQEEGGAVSKEKIVFAIQKLLSENQSGKKLSDQKIADALLAQGIRVGRRTVTKYRKELNIDSSYNR